MNPPRGYSTAKSSKKWKQTAHRREKIIIQQIKLTKTDSSETDDYDFVQFDMKADEHVNVDDDDFFTPRDEEPVKKRKYQFHLIDDKDDKLPIEMRHLRSSMRILRPEVYPLLTILKSKFHVSQTQTEAAIVHVENMLFKRKNAVKCIFANIIGLAADEPF